MKAARDSDRYWPDGRHRPAPDAAPVCPVHPVRPTSIRSRRAAAAPATTAPSIFPTRRRRHSTASRRTAAPRSKSSVETRKPWNEKLTAFLEAWGIRWRTLEGLQATLTYSFFKDFYLSIMDLHAQAQAACHII